MQNPTNNGGKEDRGQNIQVAVRVRPLNAAEKKCRAYSIVETPSHKEIIVKGATQANTKNFQFDRVFGSQSEQLQVYRSVVEPLIDQVMMGYNCTVFAYGQTGTGKTFTMEGGVMRGQGQGLSWDQDPTSGVIPRALSQIFDKLKEAAELTATESTVRVSFLELYNEEIFDLLSPPSDLSKLRLFDDVHNRGSVIIQGLEEVTVQDKQEVYSILEKGSEKRKTAETFMNAQSSRSHTVFTVTVHIKECTMDGEEVLRIGKLNLVDLAGSENIGRSGAQGSRVREASNINQSLLTLGRVISSLVEHAPHIPYRESKLTRLLQDSLGGRTKTSIIATVSPAHINHEETISTLDYAFRARNITNRPELNQKLSKTEVLKEYAVDMERLRKELNQIQSKNGVWVAEENYKDMIKRLEEDQKEMVIKAEELKVIKSEMDRKTSLFEEVEKTMLAKSREIENTKTKLALKEEKLHKVREVLDDVIIQKEEQQYLVGYHMEVENKLSQDARKLSVVCAEEEIDLDKLHGKVERIAANEERHINLKTDFKDQFETAVSDLTSGLEFWRSSQVEKCSRLNTIIGKELDTRAAMCASIAQKVDSLSEHWESMTEGLERHLVDQVQHIGQKNVANLDNIVEDKGKCMENASSEYMAALLPKLSLLADSVTAEATAMQGLVSNVNNELGNIATQVNRHTQVVTADMRHVDSLVKQLHSNTVTTTEQVADACSLLAESHMQFFSALQGLQAAYNTHETKVKEQLPRTNLPNVEPLVSPILVQSKQTVDSVDKFRSSVEDSSRIFATNFSSSSQKCIDNNVAEMNQVHDIEHHIEVFADESKAKLHEVEKEVNNKINEASSCLEDIKNTKSDEFTAQITQLDSAATEFSAKVEEILNVDKGEAKKCLKHIEEISIENKDKTKSGTEHLGQLVSQFLENGLSEYVPQNNTPVRKERRYPHFLAASSPPARVLDRFKKERERTKPQHDDSGDSGMASIASESLSRERSNSVSSVATSLATSEWDKENKTENGIHKLMQGTGSSKQVEKKVCGISNLNPTVQ